MVDVEPFARHIIHSREKLSPAESVIPRDDVAAHCEHARRQCPHVKVMYRADAVNVSHLLSQRHDVDMGRRAFQQNIHRISNQYPRTPQNHHGHQDADQRIGHLIAAHNDCDARQDRAYRPNRVRQHMEKRATNVKTVAMLSK